MTSTEKQTTNDKVVVYPGTFDPVTCGHLDVIERALKIFPHLIVAVARVSPKQALFGLEERVDMVRESVKGLDNLTIDSFDGLLIDYMNKQKATVILRGLRAVSDFEYEFQLALTNRQLDAEIESMYLMPSAEYSYLSSSLIKEIYSLGGTLETLVPESVGKKLQEKFNRVK